MTQPKFVWVVLDEFSEADGDSMTHVLGVADSLEGGIVLVNQDFDMGTQTFDTYEWDDGPLTMFSSEWYRKYRVENMGTRVRGIYSVTRYKVQEAAHE